MAHRGESENTPENTMLALESAAEIGVDVLESDVHLTKDDEVVLFHDEDLTTSPGFAPLEYTMFRGWVTPRAIPPNTGQGLWMV